MDDERLIRTIDLAGGHCAAIVDRTRHYFGGYYHVCLQVRADVPLCRDWFQSDSEFHDASQRLGESVTFFRALEKMAVPLDQIEQVRLDLLSGFEKNLQPYLCRDDFPKRFVTTEYTKVLKRSSNRRMGNYGR